MKKGPSNKHDFGTVKDIPLDEKRVGHWVRFRGRISELGGRQAHLAALAYMTDNYFIGTVSRVHNIPRFSSPGALQRALKALKNPSDLDSEGISRYFKEFAEEEASEIRASTRDGTLTANKLSSIIKRRDSRQIGMMVSLDHTIYFHDPLAFRSDDWLLCQMESPWAGEGRGLVMQKIWSRDGVHVATCVQEVSNFFSFSISFFYMYNSPLTGLAGRRSSAAGRRDKRLEALMDRQCIVTTYSV